MSGYLFESALEAGFVAAGVDVMLTGPLPTPGIAYLTSRLPRTFGVVISASHNPYEDNGIKFFDASGAKLSDELEERIEAEMERGVLTQESNRLGRARRVDALREDYQAFCAASVPGGLDLTGMKIVIDCANGAGYKVGPRLLADLGADIIPIGCSPNGRNINDGCGSTSPELLQLTVPGVGAAVGIALDGDGDRLVMVDNLGRVLDGDQLLYIIARARQQAGRAAGAGGGHGHEQPGAGTSRCGKLGIRVPAGQGGRSLRAGHAQGDRAACIGGETSGHILCLDRATTGDALVSALQVLEVMQAQRPVTGGAGRRHAALPAGAAQCAGGQALRPRDRAGHPGGRCEGRSAAWPGEGRVVLRPSGTEPVIRVMVEGRDERATQACAELHCRRRAGGGRLEPAAAPARADFQGFARAAAPVAMIARPHEHPSQNRRRQLEDARVAGRERRPWWKPCLAPGKIDERVDLRRLPAVRLPRRAGPEPQAVRPSASAPRTSVPRARAPSPVKCRPQCCSDVGCDYVLVGHSERRALYGENDALVARKFVAAQARGLTPILCVGEQLAERDAGQHP